MSTPTDIVLRIDPVFAGGQLHGWLIVPQPQYACPTLLCLWRHDRTILILLSSVVWNRRMARTAVLFRIGVGVCTDIARKLDPVLAVGWLQGWLSCPPH
jgi:hypothetical protein